MKKINTFRLGFTFAGCFLGAGYVSGQELWQFFGCFGLSAFAGLALALTLIGLFGVLLLRLAQATGISQMDALVVRRELPWVRNLLAGLECAFLFGIVVVMFAGAAALFTQLWNVPPRLGGLLFSVAVAAVALLGLRGMVDAFSLLVPVLAAVTVAIGLAAAFRGGGDAAAAVTVGGTNPLLRHWATAAVVYFAYNVFSVIGILAPLGEHIPDARTVRRGVIAGCAVLAAIALSVLLALRADGAAVSEELPMLAVAHALSGPVAVVYGLLLLSAMYGTALSSLVALLTFLSGRFARFRARRTIWAAALAAGALVCSFAGFGELVGLLYPVFGYLSLVFLALLALHYRAVRRENPELLRRSAKDGAPR